MKLFRQGELQLLIRGLGRGRGRGHGFVCRLRDVDVSASLAVIPGEILLLI